VKIPILKIREYYNSLISSVLHAQFYPLINFPGLAALIFINDGSISPGQVNDARILKKFSGVFEEINNRLINLSFSTGMSAGLP
jgi:hypothetical protein